MKRTVTNWQAKAVDYQQQLKLPRAKAFYRCGSCRMRKVLSRELWLYERPPICYCGAKNWRLDNHRYKEWRLKIGVYDWCDCDAEHYKHRKGSSVWCKHTKTEPTKQDYIDRYGALN